MNPCESQASKRDEEGSSKNDVDSDAERLSLISTHQSKQVDWVSWLCCKLNMYLLIGSLVLVSALQPMSAQVLVLSLLLTILVVVGFRNLTQEQFYCALNPVLLYSVILLSTATLAIEFFAAFML